MADDNNARYQPDDSFGRGPAQATPANDPLAELARLIGRSDPFSEYARDSRSPAQPLPPDTSARYDNDPMPSFLGNPTPPYGSELPPQHYSPEPAPQHYSPEPPPQHYSPEPAPQHYSPEPSPQHYSPEPSPQHYSAAPAPQQYSPEPAPQHYSSEPTPRYSPEYPTHNGWPGSPPPPSYPASDPFVPPQQHYAPPPAPHYDNQGYAAPNYASPPQPYADPRGRPASDNYSPGRAGFVPAGFPAPPERPGYAPPLYPHEPEAGGMPPPHDDEFYDDEPRRRRKGLLTVVAVLALAVIGTAGAFGYRSIFGGSGMSSSSSPPVIRASGEPSKVAPPAATPDPSAGKFSYDRFGDAGKDEQVVRREEKPVDLSKVAPPPRTVFPGAPVPNSTAAKQTATAATSAANPPSAIGEPRRVRTVPIRPDQGGDVAATPPAQRPATVTAPAADDPPPATRPATPRATSRVAARSPSPTAGQVPAGNAPLSLAPDASNNSLPQPAQESFPPPPRAAAPPTRVATAPASGGGSYLVQVSSQKSEADAETAYRGIKSKYSSVLGSHPHTVRRADLGSKGVYYRAMVGPFGSREEAVQVCSSLKQAGGDCVVQH
jgi:hypothetical protein